MKMIILRFAPGAIHPQAEAWGLLAFSIKYLSSDPFMILNPANSTIQTLTPDSL
jgi:hypothetical protein